MSEIARNSTGLSGEYVVATEPSRRGWSGGMTTGNAKAVDLLIKKILYYLSIDKNRVNIL